MRVRRKAYVGLGGGSTDHALLALCLPIPCRAFGIRGRAYSGERGRYEAGEPNSCRHVQQGTMTTVTVMVVDQRSVGIQTKTHKSPRALGREAKGGDSLNSYR
ncbi:hypothetical protein LZ31DRAFT_549647 [Colletotrichum somersetense]|nr:hypothetical protein LZ31DRAFT_549647 [Colletotrichum somersetense]